MESSSSSATMSCSSTAASLLGPPAPNVEYEIVYSQYEGEHQLPQITALIEKELSEPYIIYTYRYFLIEWPHLCYLAYAVQRSSPSSVVQGGTASSSSQDKVNDASGSHDASAPPSSASEAAKEGSDSTGKDAQRRIPVGVIVCKQDRHLKGRRLDRGYIAMLSVHPGWRKRRIASQLVSIALTEMMEDGAEEIVLETEVDNAGALSLYESLGFIREKRLYRFYLNGKDSYRLVLPVPERRDERRLAARTEEEARRLRVPVDAMHIV